MRRKARGFTCWRCDTYGRAKIMLDVESGDVVALCCGVVQTLPERPHPGDPLFRSYYLARNEAALAWRWS